MPFNRPTLSGLRSGALQNIIASRIFDAVTGQVVNPLLLQFDPLTIMAKVMAGLAYEEYGYLDYISLEATPYTAVDENALAWAGLVGMTLKPATAATGTAAFTGPSGVDIPVGTALVRADGVSYQTTADVVIPSSGQVVVPFQAVNLDAASTIAAGVIISIASPIAGVASDGAVAAATAPGSDIETMDRLRARYLARFAAPPQGGSASDFLAWALAVPAVTRAWVTGSPMGPGSVGIYVMMDASEARNGGFPVGTNGISAQDNGGRPRESLIATGDQGSVADALVPLQPVTALVYVSAPIPSPVAITISNLGTANTGPNQVAIRAALTAALAAVNTPLGQTILPSLWNAAIASVIPAFTLTAPAAPVVVPVGLLATVGAVAFNT